MRTEITQRIAGERVRVVVTIGVMEAISEYEDSMIAALDRIRLGSVRLIRVAMREMMRAAGRDGDVDKFLDDAIERAGLAPFSALAFEALSDAYAKAAEAASETGEAMADQEGTNS